MQQVQVYSIVIAVRKRIPKAEYRCLIVQAFKRLLSFPIAGQPIALWPQQCLKTCTASPWSL